MNGHLISPDQLNCDIDQQQCFAFGVTSMRYWEVIELIWIILNQFLSFSQNIQMPKGFLQLWPFVSDNWL